MVLKHNVRKCARNNYFGIALAGELLKQINAKQGGDLYHLALAKPLYGHTMLVGIDVCHYGPRSIVGFCATMNKTYSKYYSQAFY